MKHVRWAIAAVAAAAIVGLTVAGALAAPGAFEAAAAPSASAAGAVYCPPAEKQRRRAALQAFERNEPAERRAFFASHPSPSARQAFLRRQQAQHQALVAAYAHCF